MSSPTSITFAGNSLMTNNIITSDIVHESIPTKDAKIYALAHASRSVIPFTSYPTKKITVNGYITNSGQASEDGILDTFRGYFTGTDQNLDIQYYNSTRRYLATVNALTIDRPGGLTLSNFSIEFMTTIPFGMDTFSGMLLKQSARSSSNYSDSITVGGNAPWQWPYILVNYTAASGTNSSVQFGNIITGQQIAIQRTWSNGDVLAIDVKNRTVIVNGSPTTFSGAFPEFAPGAGTLTYADTLGSRTFNISVSNINLWL